MPKVLLYSYAAFLLAYLIGSLSFAVIISKLMRLPDPRTVGSKNPGATNVLRTGSKVAAVLTLLLDGAKGFAPVFAVRYFSSRFGFDDNTEAFVGVAAFLGHLWPVFFGFKGGKGVSTALGVLLAFSPWLGLSALICWIVVAVVTRYSSLAAMAAAVVVPIVQLLFFDKASTLMAVCFMSLLLLWRHRRNIVNLMAGREARIGEVEPDKKRRRRRYRELAAGAGPRTGAMPVHRDTQ